MLRRDFLKAFSAFGAALAAGVRMPSGQEVEQALPVQPPALETPTPTYSAKSAQDMVMEKLKECDVVHYSRMLSVGDHDRFQVTYRYIEGQTPSADNLNSTVEPMVAGKRPVSITVSSYVDSVDITSLDRPMLWSPPETAVVEIEVIWA
jgi:hypothetical protein